MAHLLMVQCNALQHDLQRHESVINNGAKLEHLKNNDVGEKTMDMLCQLTRNICQMSYYEISAKMITAQLASVLKHRASSKIRLQASKEE